MTTVLKVTHEAYDSLVTQTVDQIITLGINKGGEYSGDRNRVESFVRNAIALRLEPEQVWAVYAGKHWDAVIQYINDLADGKSRTRSEPITGRVDDLMVYLLLLKAMMIARTCTDNTYAVRVSEKKSDMMPEGWKPEPEKQNYEELNKVPLTDIPQFLTEKREREEMSLDQKLADAVADAANKQD